MNDLMALNMVSSPITIETRKIEGKSALNFIHILQIKHFDVDFIEASRKFVFLSHFPKIRPCILKRSEECMGQNCLSYSLWFFYESLECLRSAINLISTERMYATTNSAFTEANNELSCWTSCLIRLTA